MDALETLLRMHDRLSALEALWDLNFTDSMGNTNTIRGHGKIYACDLAVREGATHTVGNSFFDILNTRKALKVQIWAKNAMVNPLTSLFVRKEIYYATTTMGVPRPVTVCLVEGRRGVGGEVLWFAVKFREGEHAGQSMTERELQNILFVNSKPDLANFFPTFFFAVNIPSPIPNGPVWEGIAMEALVQIPLEKIETMNLYSRFAQMLHALHKTGHAHGDPHSMNFMFKKSGASDRDYQIRFIDADTLRGFSIADWSYDSYKDVKVYTLPDDDPRRHPPLYTQILAAKVLIIQDFNKLLFMENQFLDLTNHATDQEGRQAVHRFLQHKFQECQATKHYKMIFCPWHYTETWAHGTADWASNIYAAVSADQGFHVFLDKITLNYIAKHYMELFTLPHLRILNKKLNEEFRAFTGGT